MPALSDSLRETFLKYDPDYIEIHHIDIGRRALSRIARDLKLEVLLPAANSLGADFSIPWLAYAYDFQHKHFAEYFTAQSLRARDNHFARLMTEARAVITNSRAAANDIATYVPQATARVFILPFAPALRVDWLNDQPDILSQYQVTQPFFIISNQFWLHKNHATAFEAFRLVAATTSDVTLVCTGLTSDMRDPAYFPRLLDFLKTHELEDRVQILGLIPKRDQVELMKRAVAVIQPTLFEGGPGGGSVYDAVSLGVPAIVSDIPVNRELPDANIAFFPPRNAFILSELMKTQLSVPRKESSRSDLVSAGQRYRANCGIVLWQAIDFLRDRV